MWLNKVQHGFGRQTGELQWSIDPINPMVIGNTGTERSEEFWTTHTRTSTNYGLKRRHVVHPSGSKWSLIGLNAPFPKTWKCAIEQINKGFLGPGWSLPLVHYMMTFVGLVPRQGTPEWVPREQSLCDLLFLGSVRGAKKPWPWGTLNKLACSVCQ